MCIKRQKCEKQRCLTSEDLLEQCLEAFTQNNNDSINSLIWTFAPKHLHCGKKTVKISNFLAVVIFNEGFRKILKIMEVMGIKLGQIVKACVDARDGERI